MHGLIGQFADDPVRLGTALLTLAALLAIGRCLSGLAFFDNDKGAPD